jgi:hypothetical protein
MKMVCGLKLGSEEVFVSAFLNINYVKPVPTPTLQWYIGTRIMNGMLYEE